MREARVGERVQIMALADRAEALSGPCRETDALIEQALAEPDARYGSFHQPPAYTASIDAAMTLAGPVWRLTPFAESSLWRAESGSRDKGEAKVAFAATPALALTAASLRAIGEGL
jgi:hypothetical protein